MCLLDRVRVTTARRRKHTLNSSTRDIVLDRLGASSVDLAAHTEGGAENLLHNTLQALGEGLESHGSGNVNDLIQCDRLGVLDVLLLLAIPRGLLQCPDDEGRRGRDDRDCGLTVLDGELDGHT